MNRSVTSIVFGLLITATVLGCSRNTSNASSGSEVTIATPVGPTSGPLYVANTKGMLSQEHLKPHIVPFTSGRLALDALLSGRAQIALVAETPLVFAASQNHKFYIIATITKSPHKVVFLNRSHIGRPQDLKGKKVSALQGSAGAYWMYCYLKANGLKMSDVNFINLQPADMITSLVRGNIDAFFSWEPYPYLAQKQLGSGVRIQSSSGIYTQQFNVVVTQEYAEKHADTLKKFLLSLILAERFMKDNRPEAIHIVAQNSGMNEMVLNAIWSENKFVVHLDPSLISSLRSEALWAQATKLTPKTATQLDYKVFIDDKILKAIDPAAVTIH